MVHFKLGIMVVTVKFIVYVQGLCVTYKKGNPFFIEIPWHFVERNYQLTLHVNICLEDVPLLINLYLLDSLCKVISILEWCTRFPGIRTMMKFYAFVMLFGNNDIGYAIKTINLWSRSKPTPQNYTTPIHIHAHLKSTVSLMHSRRECLRIGERWVALLTL